MNGGDLGEHTTGILSDDITSTVKFFTDYRELIDFWNQMVISQYESNDNLTNHV
jgi:hypothetical protein